MSANQLFIGDAVLPRDEPDHDVMTVYDFMNGGFTARCNWVVGTKMFKRDIPVRQLVRVERHKL